MLAALAASSPAQGMVHIAAVNADKFKTFLYRYKITMYPAISIFAKYKHSPRRYKGESSMCICTYVCVYACMCMDCVTGEDTCPARSTGVRSLWSRICFRRTFQKQFPFVFCCHSVSCLTLWNFQYAFCGNTALGKPLEVLESFFHGINKMAPSFGLRVQRNVHNTPSAVWTTQHEADGIHWPWMW